MANENKASGKQAMVHVVADGLSTVGKRHLDAGTVVTPDDFEKARDFEELVSRGVIIQKAAASVEEKPSTEKKPGDAPG